MDPNAYEAGLRACRVAAAAGADIVAMDYTRSPEVNRAAAISVTSHEHIEAGARPTMYADYAEQIRDTDGCTTVVTCGEDGCFVAAKGERGRPAVHVPAYSVEVVDSTGAGDIFRAGLVYGHLQGWPMLETTRFASAAAALNCTRLGGWGGVTSVSETLRFQSAAAVRPAPTM
jgi:sugar/nucleoside kinase (ribokinase family)